MKTQTKNANNGKRNFFQKTIILLSVLAFTSIASKCYSQKMDINVYNDGGCTVTITAYDFSMTTLLSQSFISNAIVTNSGCSATLTTTPYRIDVKKGLCTTSFYATSSTSGIINYTSTTTSCAGCSYTRITCAGSGGGTACSGANDYNYLVEILQ